MLLGPEDPAPFRTLRERASSPFLFTADHAGNIIPHALGNLGISEVDRTRHIAWDIGIASVTERLSELLGATAILQTYSRLVVDCNRRPDLSDAFPKISETTPIPGNAALSKADRDARSEAIFRPYHDAIKHLIAMRRARRQPTLYVAMHSFTPVFKRVSRPMEVAVLYNRSPRLSRAIAGLLRGEAGLKVAENEPYRVTDETDYGVPVHAEAGGLDYVEIEIRQDLIETDAGQVAWAERLGRLLPRAAMALVSA